MGSGSSKDPVVTPPSPTNVGTVTAYSALMTSTTAVTPSGYIPILTYPMTSAGTAPSGFPMQIGGFYVYAKSAVMPINGPFVTDVIVVDISTQSIPAGYLIAGSVGYNLILCYSMSSNVPPVVNIAFTAASSQNLAKSLTNTSVGGSNLLSMVNVNLGTSGNYCYLWKVTVSDFQYCSTNPNCTYCKSVISATSGTADALMQSFCTANPGNSHCSCIYSKSSGVGNPLCLDQTCIKSGYATGSMMAQKPCPTQINCTQNTTLISNGISLSTNVQVDQQCGNTSTESVPASTINLKVMLIILLVIVVVVVGVGFYLLDDNNDRSARRQMFI